MEGVLGQSVQVLQIQDSSVPAMPNGNMLDMAFTDMNVYDRIKIRYPHPSTNVYNG